LGQVSEGRVAAGSATCPNLAAEGTEAQPSGGLELPHEEDEVVTLVLVRHGMSIWNKDNRFTAWMDVPLSRCAADTYKHTFEYTPLPRERERDRKRERIQQREKERDRGRSSRKGKRAKRYAERELERDKERKRERQREKTRESLREREGAGEEKKEN